MWLLEPSLHHLNHGSFGAVPIPVLTAQRGWQDRFERDPVGFVERELLDALDTARAAWAGLLGTGVSGVVPVRNTTTGISTVLAAVADRLAPGQEILITDHTYNATRLAVEAAAARRHLTVRIAVVPFPLRSAQEARAAILDAVGPRTGLAVLDLVTSPTALRLPLEPVIAALEPEVPVLVDGAHGPGMVPMDVDAWGASFVVGNGHKWLCAPRGSAVLVVAEAWRDAVRPLVVSHGWDASFAPDRSRLHATFDWVGTDDPTPWLCVPDAIATLSGLHPDGLAGLMAANRALALTARQLICDALGIDPPAPQDMIGSMASVPLPGDGGAMLDPIGGALRERGFVVGAFGRPRRLLRVSAHAYNTVDEYAQLAALLPTILR
jgi:isopenicillin-N epimerase